ncbi:MAG: alpha/beta hydrolase [Verrucomicrobia bacterium]|nr:alpha/beta hydrolase [Verrucomicrobiota bacterium]
MKALLAFCALALFSSSWLMAAEPVPFQRTEVIYGRKFGTALTLDVIQPAKTNGYGVISIISGGFFSSHDGINPGLMKPFLDRGYTVFAVVHGSQPKFTIPEIVEDLHRSVRWIRSHATDYGIRPDRLGVFGASAGGHLSLTLGTQGKVGPANAKDPVDRESSEVQAVACFFPPTDYLNWREPGDDAVGVGVLKDFKPAFGPRSDTAESRAVYGKEISPVNFITPALPPTLIIHGDADALVPIYQAEQFLKKSQDVGVKAPVKVDRRPGKLHGWDGIEKDLVLFADWFDLHLRGIKP